MSALPKGWTVEKLMANRHMGAALLGDTIEEGKAIRAAIDRLLTRSGGGAFGPALLANSPEEVETLKRELRGETAVESATDGDAPISAAEIAAKAIPVTEAEFLAAMKQHGESAPKPRKRNRSAA